MDTTVRSRFRGCLLGAMVGDVIGAVVEGESSPYIRATYPDVEAILAAGAVRKLLGPPWIVGRYTDTIASMTGALGGALMGEEAIPASWLAAVREDEYDVSRMRRLADELFEAATG